MKKHFSVNVFHGKIEQDPEVLKHRRAPNPNDWSKQPMRSTDQSIITPEQECSISECKSRKHAKGYCKRHYQQQWSTGSPNIKRPNPRGTPEQRFWRYVKKGAADECWNWTGFRDKDGYGKFRASTAVNTGAHRFSYALHKHPIPDSQLVRHTCNNSACVNPGHLALGDHIDNMQDRLAAGHYPVGEKHPFAKFSDEVVEEVRVASGTYLQIGQRFGMSESQVGNIKLGRQRAGGSAGKACA